MSDVSSTLQKASETFLAELQEAALPGIWSKGVALSREAKFAPDKMTPEEVTVRVLVPGRPVHPRVNLWLTESDSYCDCGDRNEPCVHIVAAALALKNGLIELAPAADAGRAVMGVSYRFAVAAQRLSFERWVCAGGDETLLAEPLTSYIGGIQSGRISKPSPAATQQDFKIDQLLSFKNQNSFQRSDWAQLLKLLEDSADVRLNGENVSTSGNWVEVQAELVPESASDGTRGMRLRRKVDAAIDEVFAQGVVRMGRTLRPVRELELSAEERELLKGEGTVFKPADFAALVTDVIPRLSGKISLSLPSQGLPVLSDATPRIEIEVDREGPDALSAVANIVYGDPPVARVRFDLPLARQLESLSKTEIPRRELAGEKNLIQNLQTEFHLQPGQRVRLYGDEAPAFLERLSRHQELIIRNRTGAGAGAASETLRPEISVGVDGSLQVSFKVGQSDPQTISDSEVLRAWRENRSYLPLLSGSWAALPKDWLSRYGETIEALLLARDHQAKLPNYRVPEIARICTESNIVLPDPVARFTERLQNFRSIEDAALPKDLTVEPRAYQRQGINWLSFLREHEMGALLADDMGLGKTLQALCAIQGRALIVCPTSVLSSWQEQAERFRPGLKLSLYHGSGRKLDPKADITLTTYGILRMDRELLSAQAWRTAVLDEAHIIKNPDSQMAQAAHALQSKFKIALSGTPVENKLLDLWSVFHFINPGLLGSRERFEEMYVEPISRGRRDAQERLRTQVRPFLLRRLKKEVAPELPPRTEVHLECELSEDERKLYDSVLLAQRSQALSELGHGGSVFQALEALLRLRQACCHPALLPGQPWTSPSAKTSLLVETLQNSAAMGHRSLVFSQWTSFLDIIEKELRTAGLEFVRLDGTTPNRQQVIQKFKAPDGPPVFLLSLKAGGVGLTLTEADHVFILDPWWNPTVEDQAADRAHRIGQENPVLIHRLVAKDTIEERVLALQKEKQRLSGAILDGSSQAVSLTREDLFALLN